MKKLWLKSDWIKVFCSKDHFWYLIFNIVMVSEALRNSVVHAHNKYTIVRGRGKQPSHSSQRIVRRKLWKVFIKPSGLTSIHKEKIMRILLCLQVRWNRITVTGWSSELLTARRQTKTTSQIWRTCHIRVSNKPIYFSTKLTKKSLQFLYC